MAHQVMESTGNIYIQSQVIQQQISTTMPRHPSPLYAFPDLRENIVGREDDVKKLDEKLTEHHRVLILGIGGLGKTSLATLCSKEWVKQEKYEYAVFINMETVDSAKTEFCALSEYLFNTKTYSRNTVKEVYAYYNEYKSLFVLDNIEDNGLLATYLPPDECTNIYVLGTSQFTELEDVFKLYYLGTLTDTASLELIKQIFQKKQILLNTDATEKVMTIIEMLDYHPMALQHAAALISNTKYYTRKTILECIDEYIYEINQKLQENPPTALLSDYRRSVFKSIELNIEKATENVDVRTLLFCMAYLDPSRIDTTMFYNHPQFNKNKILTYLSKLNRYCIITENKDDFNIISMHRLIPIICYELIKKYTETNYIQNLFHIFFYYEDCRYIKNSLKKHFSSLIHHSKLPKETLSKLYIDSFKNHEKIMNYLRERLKLISCDDTDIEDWTVLHYCVFAGHKTLFEYFNETVDQDKNLYINLYYVQIVSNSTTRLFYSEYIIQFSFIQCVREQKNKWVINGLTILHICAAYGVNVNGFIDLLKSLRCDQNESDNNSMTYILWAAKNMVYDLVFALYKNGAEYDPIYKDLLSAASRNDCKLVLTLLRTSEVNYATSVFGKMLLWWGADHVTLTHELIERGTDVTGADGRGNTLLHLTALYGNYNLTIKLINNGVNVNSVNCSGVTPLHYAAGHGHSEVVTKLICAGAMVHAADKSSNTPLHRAARHGDSKFATELILAGANVHAADKFGEMPLHHAARYGHSKFATELIGAGANVNAADNSGETPLHHAARHGHSKFATVLIHAKANVNAADKSGETPLHSAARHGYSKFATELIRAGANVDAADKSGVTPLHYAAGNDYSEFATELILARVNVDAADKSGDTPLHYAARDLYSEFATILIQAGAKVNVVNMSDETPLDLCRKTIPWYVSTECIGQARTQLEELLIKHGATDRRGQ